MSILDTENALTSLLGILCAFYFVEILADAVLTIISWLEKHQERRAHQFRDDRVIPWINTSCFQVYYMR